MNNDSIDGAIESILASSSNANRGIPDPVNYNFSESASIEAIQSDAVNFDHYVQSQDMPAQRTSEVNFGDIVGIMGRTGATFLVAGSKALAGLADLNEHLSDGLLWTGGKLLEGGSFAGAQIIGIFNSELKDTIMDGRDILKQDVKDRIEEDQVGAIEELVFNTQMGKTINDASYLKYDSGVANGIESIFTTGTEIGVATAATVLSGGTIAPVVLAAGFLDGTGEQAQKTYQNYDNVTGLQEAAIMFSGAAGAAKWYAMGKLGEGTINTVNQVRALPDTATPATVSETFHDLWSTRRARVRNPLQKSRLYFNRGFQKGVIDMTGGVFESLAKSASNPNSSVASAVLETGSTFLTNCVTNTVFSGLDDVAGGLRSVSNYSLSGRVESLVNTIAGSVDAVEDSGLIDVNPLHIFQNITERSE